MKEGDRAIWESQSGGSWKEKIGTVIREIPAGESAKQYLPNSAKTSHIKFDVDRSANNRVLVAVPAGKTGQITHYYCPMKSIVSWQEKEALQ